MKETTHFHLLLRLMSTALPPLPHMPLWHAQGQPFTYFTLHTRRSNISISLVLLGYEAKITFQTPLLFHDSTAWTQTHRHNQVFMVVHNIQEKPMSNVTRICTPNM